MSDTSELNEILSLSSRIVEAMQGDSGGLEVSMLAWEYAAAVEKANEDLKECAALLSKGASIDSFIRIHLSPKLIERAESLKFDQREQWDQCCDSFGWKKAEPLNEEVLNLLKSSFQEGEKLKEWLIGIFRERRSSENPEKAIPVIQVILDLFPEDAGLKAEYSTLQKKTLAQAEADFMALSAGLLPDETPKEVIERYLACNVDLPKSDPEVKAYFEAERAEKETALLSKVGDLLHSAENTSDDNWKEIEQKYLNCEYEVYSSGLKDVIDVESLEKLKSLTAKIEDYRGAHDMNMQLKDAVEALPSAKGTEAKEIKETISHLKERIHELKYELLPELQNDVAKAPKKEKTTSKKKEKSSKNGLWIGLGAAASLAISVGVWIFLQGSGKVSDSPKKIVRSESAVTESLEEAVSPSAEGSIEETPELEELTVSSEPGVPALEEPMVQSEPEVAKIEESEVSAPEVVSAVADESEIVARVDESPSDMVKRYQERLDKAYEDVANELEALISQEYTPEMDREVMLLLEIAAEKRTVASDSPEVEAVARRIEELEIRFIDIKTPDLEDLIAIAEDLKKNLDEKIEAVEASKDLNDFDSTSEEARTVLAELKQAQQDILEIDSGYSDEAVATLESRLAETGDKWTDLIEIRDQLSQAQSLDDYIKPLRRIENLDIASSVEKEGALKILGLQSEFENMLQKLVVPGGQEVWKAFASAEDYKDATPSLSFSERALLQKLARATLYSKVFVSNVRFYQGSDTPQSEEKVYLSQPITNIDKKSRKGINQTFIEYGFDLEGRPSNEPRSVSILSQPDGSAFGYFYEVSYISPESEYFFGVIQPTLNAMVDGAPRFTAIELAEKLNRMEKLSPAFRVYWKGQLLAFMSKDPWKWGLKLSPTLQREAIELTQFEEDGLNHYTWLSTVERESPSEKYLTHLKSGAEQQSKEEAIALASLLQTAARGKLVPVGFADASGKIHYTSKINTSERLWTLNPETGELEQLVSGMKLSAYMPVVSYRIGDQDAEQILEDTSKSSGMELNGSSFNPLLPPLFAK